MRRGFPEMNIRMHLQLKVEVMDTGRMSLCMNNQFKAVNYKDYIRGY